MKEVKNCKKCNILFSTYDGAMLCKKCEAEEEETFRMVRDFLYDNPRISIQELSLKFNISVNRIEQYIRSGRINVL